MQTDTSPTASPPTTPRRCTLLRTPAVLEAYGVSRPALYSHMKDGLFPRPIKLGEKLAVWPSDEVYAVVNWRIAGKSVEEIRELVAELMEARKTRA
tara:strand:- start:4829 stop:5116 length:288 start_codon:yes stop_codon:yes gene_type:complete